MSGSNDRTLQDWLRWHHKQSAAPVAAAERLFSGSLEYTASDFVGAGIAPTVHPALANHAADLAEHRLDVRPAVPAANPLPALCTVRRWSSALRRGGTLLLRLFLAGAWVDRPSADAALAAADGRAFNLLYELEGGVPLYDRALQAPLSDTAAVSPDVRMAVCPLERSINQGMCVLATVTVICLQWPDSLHPLR